MPAPVYIPFGVRLAASRGLKLRAEYGRGGTEVGLRTARKLTTAHSVSFAFVRKVSQYFPRHAGDNLHQRKPPSNGYIAWLLWGGTPGRRWAEGVVRREQRRADRMARTPLGHRF